MNIFSTYRFFLTHPDEGTRQVYPRLDDFQLKWSRERGKVFYQKELTSPLIIEKGDFDWLVLIEADAAKRCKNVTVLIEVYEGGVWQTLYEGIAKMNAAKKWNYTYCTVELNVERNDLAACVERNWKKSVNILQSGLTRYTAGVLQGFIEETTCIFRTYTGIFASSPPNNDICINSGEGWTVKQNTIRDMTLEDNEQTYEGSIQTVWVREKVENSATEPDGDGWVNLGNNNWARQPAKVFNENESVFNPEGGIISTLFEIIGEAEYDNGVYLHDVIEVLNPCPDELTVESIFFGVNSDGLLGPNNAAYVAADGNLTEIILWQKTDVLFADAYENAVRANLTFQQLMEMLENMTNARWAVEGNKLVIEHYSYFEGLTNSFDLTTREGGVYIRGVEEYDYDSQNLNKYERFSWQDEVQNRDFAGVDIEYGDCATEENEKNYPVNLFTTDFAYMELNTEAIEKVGFAVAVVKPSTNGQRLVINRENGILGGQSLVNGHLTFSNLHDKYFRHGRLLLSGDMNNTATVFESAIKTKQERGIEFPIELDELLSFRPVEKINTNLGWGEIETAEFSAKNQTLTVDLLHD